MGNELILLCYRKFGDINMELYKSDNVRDVFLSAQQIGEALEYDKPSAAISGIHSRFKDRFDKLSIRQNITTERGVRPARFYNIRGVLEIIRWSHQPKTDEFMDWVMDCLFNEIGIRLF